MARSLRAVVALALLVASPAALAKKDDDGHGHGHRHDDGGNADAVVVNVDVNIFSPAQRVVYRDYWGERYGKGCPPGLAKKNNGCMPPGLAKKRYQRGYPPPHGVVVAPVPPELRVRIGAPPPGYLYGMIDGDLVKLAVGTYLVVDALEGLTD